jgi:hypothetical protein
VKELEASHVSLCMYEESYIYERADCFALNLNFQSYSVRAGLHYISNLAIFSIVIHHVLVTAFYKMLISAEPGEGTLHYV